MHRLGEQLRARVLQEEAARPGPQRRVDVLVEVEGRDHDDREWVFDAGPGEGERRLDAVGHRHPDVEEAHVGPDAPRERHGFGAVGRLAHDLDVGLRVEDHPEPGAHELLVVGDEHAHAHVDQPERGSAAVTAHPPPGAAPASQVPPRSVARSIIPVMP